MIFNRLDILTPEELERIVDTSCSMLEQAGFRFEWDFALNLMREHGCKVDMDAQMVWIPRRLVMEALEKMHPLAAPQEYPKLFWAPWIGMKFIDHKTQQPRSGTLQDCKNIINVVNHLENVSVSSTGVVPQDVDNRLPDLYMAELLFKYSEKIFTTWTFTVDTCRDIVEMALAVTGGEKELKESAIINYLAEPVSPLKLSRHSLEIIKLYGEMNQAINMGSMVQVGTTGPATLAGSVALQLAEDLASLAYLYCLGSQSPVSLGGPMQVADLKNGNCLYAPPELPLIHLGIVACAHHLGYLSGCTSGLTETNYPDFQNGWDRGMSMILLWAAGSEALGMRGQIGAGQGFSLDELALENEMGGMMMKLSQGISVNDDTLALDIIESVGIGGSYSKLDHTNKHFGEYWKPELFSHEAFEEYWANYKHLALRAHEKVERILESYSLELQIPQDVADEIDRIRDRRIERLKG